MSLNTCFIPSMATKSNASIMGTPNAGSQLNKPVHQPKAGSQPARKAIDLGQLYQADDPVHLRSRIATTERTADVARLGIPVRFRRHLLALKFSTSNPRVQVVKICLFEPTRHKNHSAPNQFQNRYYRMQSLAVLPSPS